MRAFGKMVALLAFAAVSGSVYDAIVICGGGLEADTGAPLPWVLGRLNTAINRSAEAEFLLALSRGTTHEPPPLDANGFPIDEAKASADYLVQHGIEPKRVLEDTWSLDTIGICLGL